MAQTDPKRVRSIFLAAVEGHAPEQWSDYLGTACRGEPELRQRVESLLRGHGQHYELLDDPNSAPVSPIPASIGEGPGTLIGPYKLLEQIGEGGFGVVFMAEQLQPVRRKVALKIVKPGMDTRQVVARFEAERQALALMDHPHIAQIFDGGATESGRPYFVMELVRGIPITEFCDRHHLGIRERLDLFTHVCQAVQHAHQKGIIHRDLKPSNVMVTQHDVTPVVKIIDFGIAKATGPQLTDKTLFTNFVQMIGTPLYMSPEQAQMSGLDVDTRTDVYSLGVLLYELMTGHTPFDKERLRTVAYDEMIRIIREEEPVRPSTRISTLGAAAKTAPMDRNSTPQKLSQLLKGELDWIVMKALEKDRKCRYDSASALGHDVQRYLHDEPVQACPPTVGYRLRKAARRHKAALATAAIVLVALSVGMAVAVWQAVVATRAKQVAMDSAAAEKTAKMVAEAKEAEAQAVVAFLQDRVLSAARPVGYFGGMGPDVSLQSAIEASVPFVQEGFKDQPLIEARLRTTLGQSFAFLGDWKKGAEQFEAARAIFTRDLGPDKRPTLWCMAHLGWCYSAAGRHEEGRKILEETFDLQKTLLGLDHEETLNSMEFLASNLDDSGRYADALTLREDKLARCRAKFGPDHDQTLRAMNNLSVSYSHLGRENDVFQLREYLVKTREVKLGPDHPDTIMSSYNLANSYHTRGRYREACQLHEKVLSWRKVNLGLDHPATLSSMYNVARCLQSLGRRKDALKLTEETLSLRKRRLGPDHPDTLMSMNSLALSYTTDGRNADAIALFEETARLQKTKLGPNHADTLNTVHNLAINYRSVGRHQEALSLDVDTLARRQAHLGADHLSTLRSMLALAGGYRKIGRHAEALPLYEQTFALRTAKLGAGHPETINSQAGLASCLFDLNRGAEAVPILDDCIRLALKSEIRHGFANDQMGLRMRHFLKLKDLMGCRATAAMWDDFGRTDANSLYDAACFHALVAGMSRDQDPSAEGEKRSNSEADVAMDRLRKAVAAGYRNSAHMAKDADLDVLRKRSDFIKLMAEIPAADGGPIVRRGAGQKCSARVVEV